MSSEIPQENKTSYDAGRRLILIGIFAVPALLVGVAVIINTFMTPGVINTVDVEAGSRSNPLPDQEQTDVSGESPLSQNPSETGQVKDFDGLRVNVRHILVSYKGAKEAEENIVLSKDEAYDIALEIKDQLDKDPSSFERIAKKNSHDKATGKLGGLIPGFRLKDVSENFKTAVMNLSSDGISNVVETEYGFHILKRENIEEGIFQSILIPYKGALHASEDISRSPEEARAEAERLLKSILSGEATFTETAVKFSMDPWRENNGFMRGLVQTGNIPHKEIEDNALRLKTGEVSGVFKSPLGYHILKRHPIEGRQACQIVALFGGEGRVEEMARRLINEAMRELKDGRAFSEVVREYSDESFEKTGGGFTPVIYRGTWSPKIEEKLFSLKIGQVSKPFKLDYGWIIIARVR